MINSILKIRVNCCSTDFASALVFNNIQFSGYVNPYVYIMIILILPAVIPSWLLTYSCIFNRMIIDLFSGSPGMHASATLLAGFSRPYVFRLISPRDGYESGSDLSMSAYGVQVVFYLYCNNSSDPSSYSFLY